MNKFLFVVLSLLISFGIFTEAEAKTKKRPAKQQEASLTVEFLGETMSFGDTDPTPGSGPVSQLQKFLQSKGYLKMNIPYGYFGPLTKRGWIDYKIQTAEKALPVDKEKPAKNQDEPKEKKTRVIRVPIRQLAEAKTSNEAELTKLAAYLLPGKQDYRAGSYYLLHNNKKALALLDATPVSELNQVITKFAKLGQTAPRKERDAWAKAAWILWDVGTKHHHIKVALQSAERYFHPKEYEATDEILDLPKLITTLPLSNPRSPLARRGVLLDLMLNILLFLWHDSVSNNYLFKICLFDSFFIN
jgi:hypothetical protein